MTMRLASRSARSPSRAARVVLAFALSFTLVFVLIRRPPSLTSHLDPPLSTYYFGVLSAPHAQSEDAGHVTHQVHEDTDSLHAADDRSAALSASPRRELSSSFEGNSGLNGSRVATASSASDDDSELNGGTVSRDSSVGSERRESSPDKASSSRNSPSAASRSGVVTHDGEVDVEGESAKVVDKTASGGDESLSQRVNNVQSTPPGCAKYIVYDKPIKTGSSAIAVALKRWLVSKGIKSETYARDAGTALAQDICDGLAPPRHLVGGHMWGSEGLLECLREKKGYFVATSIRLPFSRWESSFLYNRKKEATHFGIPHTANYSDFMSRFPSCSLLEYYDSLGWRCDRKLSVEERVKKIVPRYDEIIDLYDDNEKMMGPLQRQIKSFLNLTNLSPRPDEAFRDEFDQSRLENETVLYEAFRNRRRELSRVEPRPLCLE